MNEGRIEHGLRALGTRYAPEDAHAAETSMKGAPIEGFRRFHADTATFGSRIGIDAARSFFGDHQMYFASDFPFAGIKEAIRAAEGLPESILSENATALLHPANA
jgi:hypothetical protein